MQSPSPPFTLLLPLCAAICTTHTFANEVTELNPVVVSASRHAQTVAETLAPVSVISRNTIDQQQATSVIELLVLVPGVQIATTGGIGSKATVMIRGTATAHALILIDGIKANDAVGGESPLQYMDPEQIERIEVVRGPRSTLYGADAVGGVINIITRKGEGSPHLTAKIGGGSRNTKEASVNLGGKVENTQFNFGAHLYKTDGHDRSLSTGMTDGDDDAYRNTSFSASVDHQFNDRLSIGGNINHAQGYAEYDNGLNWDGSANTWAGSPQQDFNITNVNVHSVLVATEQWNTRLELGFQRMHTEDSGSQFPGITTNKRSSIAWVNDIAWQDNQLLITGIDYAEDTTEGTNRFSVTHRNNLGVFAQNTSSWNIGKLQLDARYDDNQAYGNKTTGSIAWGMDLPADMRLITSYATAFRAPTLMDLYYPGSENPDLKAENARNAEIELQGKIGAQSRWFLNLYQNDIDDMLAWGDGKMENIAKARIQGIELGVQTQIQAWQISANTSLLSPEDRLTGKRLIRRAKQLFAISVDRPIHEWSIGATLRGQGDAWDSSNNTTSHISGFATLDLRAQWQFANNAKLQLKAVNLFDRDYTTVYGYRDESRGVFAHLVLTPNF